MHSWPPAMEAIVAVGAIAISSELRRPCVGDPVAQRLPAGGVGGL